MTAKNNHPIEPGKMPTPHRPLNTWKHMVAYICIWFLVVVLVMVYFTSTGSPQAGLLEVGAAALIFVVLFHLVMKFFPLISKIITSVIVIGFGIALIYVNYHFLKVVKKDAHLEELLVGDLLVNKIVKTIKKEPIAVVTKEEIPKIPLKPKYEKPLPPISLDQLKTTIAGPIAADIELSHIVKLAPMVKEGIMFVAEKYKTEVPTSTKNAEISALAFTKKGCEQMIAEILDTNTLATLSPLDTIWETLITVPESHQIPPPIFETIISINVIKLSEPLKEGRIPID